jgi:hypothetical protein
MWAFQGCSSLNSINIPASVWEIRDGAFKGCETLSIVTQAEIRAINRQALN